MKRAILTQAGFENKTIEKQFLKMVGKTANEIRALWILTAAINEDAKAVPPKCMGDFKKTDVISLTNDQAVVFDDAIYILG